VVDTAWHSCEYSLVFITDFKKFVLDVDLAASLLELPKAHYVGLSARNEVDTDAHQLCR
jgi:hypothetical protein